LERLRKKRAELAAEDWWDKGSGRHRREESDNTVRIRTAEKIVNQQLDQRYRLEMRLKSDEAKALAGKREQSYWSVGIVRTIRAGAPLQWKSGEKMRNGKQS